MGLVDDQEAMNKLLQAVERIVNSNPHTCMALPLNLLIWINKSVVLGMWLDCIGLGRYTKNFIEGSYSSLCYVILAFDLRKKQGSFL